MVEIQRLNSNSSHWSEGDGQSIAQKTHQKNLKLIASAQARETQELQLIWAILLFLRILLLPRRFSELLRAHSAHRSTSHGTAQVGAEASGHDKAWQGTVMQQYMTCGTRFFSTHTHQKKEG